MNWAQSGVAVIAAASVMSACSGSTGPPTGTAAGPGASNSTSTSPAISPSSAASTGTATPSSGPRSSTPTVLSDLAVRFPKTQQGAEDFVRFVMAQVSKAYATANPTLIQPLVDVATCPDCARWVSATTNMKKMREHFEGVFVWPQSVHALTLKGDAAGVITQVLVPAGKIVDSRGRVVDPRSASGPLRSDFFLQFRDHWVVTNLELVR